MVTRRMLSVVLVACVVIGTQAAAIPSAAAATPPTSFLSNYVTSLNYSNWNTYGCEQDHYSTGKASHISIVLDFGQPWDQGGQYGTMLILSGGLFAQWDSGGHSGIQYLVANFLTGYWNCHVTSSPTIGLVIGTSNDGGAITDTNNATWMGQAITNIDSWIGASGWENLESASGGMDAETEWSSYSTTVSYLDAVARSGVSIYDFGDAGGCPTNGYALNTANCNGGWGQSQVFDVAWGEAYAWPLGEIYNQTGANAQQWYWLSRLGLAIGQSAMYFFASFTQWEACQQYGGCSGTDNTPSQGWTQLYNALQQNSGTAAGAGLTYADDIRYLG